VRTGDRAALGIWLASRLATWVAAVAAGWMLADAGTRPAGLLARWLQWDAVHLAAIARYGYDGDPADAGRTPYQAFLPGFPLAVRAVHELGASYVLAGLLVSLAASAVACVALGRIGELDGPPGTGWRAVLLLVASPAAVFLAAGYTEALFLAFALPAWLAARRGDWRAAGLLAAVATTVRVTGVFLAAALVVHWLAGRRAGGGAAAAPQRAGLWLLSPAVPVAAFVVYQHARTGDWLAWSHAQAQGWGRSFTWPWDALATTWRAAFTDAGQPPQFAFSFRLELAAMLVGLLLTGWLLWRRRWAESTYVGLQVAALATSQYYLSVPRATLLWWPLWVGLAAVAHRRPLVLGAVLALTVPLAVLHVAAFTTGRWAG